MNQSTVTTSQTPRPATDIRQTSRSSSLLPKAVHLISDELRVSFQIDRTSMLVTKPRETQTRWSTSVNGTPDSTRHRPMTLITATRNHMPVQLRKHTRTVPSPTLSFPTTVIRIWRRQMTLARSTRQIQPNWSDIGPYGP